MGLEIISNTSSTFVTIVGGKFTIRLPEGSDDSKAVERVLEKGPNAGSTIKELQFNKLSGKIIGGYMDTSDYGTNLIIRLMDDSHDTFKLQLPVESRYFGQIVKRVSNINLDMNTEFILGYDNENDRPFMYIRQSNVTVPMAYTREKPNGMPEAVEKTVKGQKKLDFTDQENFLFDVATEFVGKFDGSVGKSESGVEKVVEAFNAIETQTTDEEIPF